MLKKLLSLILVLSMLLTLSLSLASCSGDDEDDGANSGEGTNDKDNEDNKEDETPKKVNYVVTVVDEDGNPVKGVSLIFSPKGGTPFPFKTDANGVAAYTTDKELTVSVGSVPTGYEYDEIAAPQKFDADGKLTITVSKKEATGTKYTIRVIDQNGAPVVGAKVQMCEAANEGICLIPVTTNENGEGIYNATEKAYKAKTTSLPEGYEVVSDEYVEIVNYEVTIVVNKIAG